MLSYSIGLDITNKLTIKTKAVALSLPCAVFLVYFPSKTISMLGDKS